MSPSRSVRIFVLALTGTVALFVIVSIVANLAYEHVYAQRVYPGVRALQVPLGGLTEEQAKQAIDAAWKSTLSNGLRLSFENTTHPIANGETLANEYVHLDTQALAQRALRLGREGNTLAQLTERARLLMRGQSLAPSITVQEDRLVQAIRSVIKTIDVEPKNAEILFEQSRTGWTARLKNEEPGRTSDPTSVIQAFTERLEANRLQEAIPVSIRTVQPTIYATDLAPLVPEATQFASQATLRLKLDDLSWTFSPSVTLTWLTPTSTTEGYKLVLNTTRFKKDIGPYITPYLKEPRNGYMKVEEGVLKEFTAPVEGIKLNEEATEKNVLDTWRAASSTATIALTKDVPKILGDGESLGIRQVLGVGRSNFSGSPTNRRKNIALGAKKVHGVLIAPNEEFSLLKVLGVIDGENGWLPELVIKGNKTTPEFGGGLCQVGTTAFRTALRAGLPITQRQNHSYRVRYYEPAGTDATIYDPAPDFRFKNDTGNWVLITTLATKNDLAFTMWGTDDGRIVDLGEPRIYNIVPPPEKKTIESLDIPEGTEKCTEVAHAGADASLDYTVTYTGQKPLKTTFTSHYRPWGAVCLRGVKQLSTSPSSTTQIIDETGINNPR